MEQLIQSLFFVSKGLLLTIELLTGGILIGFTFGTILAICRFQSIGKGIINRFISVMRGTPLLLQLSLIYFSTPTLMGLHLSILWAGIITFGLNSSAYFAEILRAGIENVSKGQFEAATTLDIPNYFIWKDIILPQVLKNIFPALINEVISLLKETALISTIGGMDLMRHAESLAAEQFTYFMPLCLAGGYYYVLVLIIETIGKQIEKRGYYAAN